LFYFDEISYWKLVLYVVFIVLGMVVSAYKWKMLGDFKDINHSHWDYFRFYQAGTFINNFMPSFIGGDTFRAYQIGRTEKKYVEAVSSVLIDRITGFIGSTILVVLFGLLNFQHVILIKPLVVVEFLILASFLFDILIAQAKKFPFILKMSRFMPQKLQALFVEMDEYSGHRSKILSRTIVWAMIFGIVGVAIPNFILFWALGLKINILDYLSVVFIISIITAVPISINNIGIKEWAYVTFFGAFGVNTAALVTISILSRLIQMFISFFALPTYLRTRK
jgi:uncharacterized protein (TIRG00374 family)